MEMNHVAFTGQPLVVEEPSQVGQVRRSAASLARHLGMGETARGRLELVATELAANLARHARDGRVLLRPLAHPLGVGVEVVAVDRGPGMADVERCLSDGYSTVGTAGTGLGAVLRLSDGFDVYSRVGQGTVQVAEVWDAPAPHRAEEFRVAAVEVAMPGEWACGDGWAWDARRGAARFLIVDGTGHGPLAAEAARVARETFLDHGEAEPGAAVANVHAALRGTRGAAVGVAGLDLSAGSVTYAGIGNTTAALVEDSHRRVLPSMDGTAGHGAVHVREFSYRVAPEATLVLHTDGLTARWGLEGYPGLLSHHPALLAAVLFRDFARGRDDVAVVVVRQG